MDNVMNFFYKKKEGKELSNFFELEVVIEDRVYETGEHCFHGEKFYCLSLIEENEKRKKELLEYSRKFLERGLNGSKIKKLGRGLILTSYELEKWREISVEVQRKICLYKWTQYEVVRSVLEGTGSKVLIHPAMRCSEEKVVGRLWEGKGVMRDGTLVVLGGNKLGYIWMELRNREPTVPL